MGISSGRIVDGSSIGRLPIGNENFAQVIEDATYVDKSLLVRDLIDCNYSAILFCRPRRFGKSLAMRMLQCFFEAPVEGRRGIPDRAHLFDALAIRDAGDRYWSHQGAYPVIFLSLGEVQGNDWETALESIAEMLSNEYARHNYIVDQLDDAKRERFRRMEAARASRAELYTSLGWLSSELAAYHGAGTVILIDEYDRLVTLGHLRGFRDEAIDFMRSWLTGALKATTSLFRACMTGVQRVSRESVFSGLNNIIVNTALDSGFTEGFGFTSDEAEALAARQGLADKVSDMRAWYDGYRFGDEKVYNPWSVLNYLDQKGIAQPYWGNTSDNKIVHQLFTRAEGDTADQLAALASGGRVRQSLDLATVFDMIDCDPNAIWSQLYLAGYVTTDDVDEPNNSRMKRDLRVPNREVELLYRDEFGERSEAIAGNRSRLYDFHDALVEGDAPACERALRTILLDSPSALDLVAENSYHMLLVGLTYDVYGYRFPLSNREAGDGRADIALLPMRENVGKSPAVIIEVKQGRDPGDDALASLVQEALAQIDDRSYAHDIPDGPVLKWGIAFSGKRVACACSRGRIKRSG